MENDLIRRAIMNVRKNKTTLNWVHIMNIFGVGSTRAKEICKTYNIDPESTVLKGDK